MYAEIYEHPTYSHQILVQTGESKRLAAVKMKDQKEDFTIHIVPNVVLYDQAGRVPYADVC